MYDLPSFKYSEKKKRDEALKLARKVRRAYKKVLAEGYTVEPDENSKTWKQIQLAFDLKGAKKASIAQVRELAEFSIIALDKRAKKKTKTPLRYKGGEEIIDIQTKKKRTADAGEFVLDSITWQPKTKEEIKTRAEAKQKQREEASKKGVEALKKKRRERKRAQREQHEEEPKGTGSSDQNGIDFDEPIAPDDNEEIIVVENYLAYVITDLMNRGASEVWQSLVSQLEVAIQEVINTLGDDGYELIYKLIQDGTLPQAGTYMDSDGILDCIDSIAEAVTEWKQKKAEKRELSKDQVKAVDKLEKTVRDLSEYQSDESFVRDMMLANGVFDED